MSKKLLALLCVLALVLSLGTAAFALPDIPDGSPEPPEGPSTTPAEAPEDRPDPEVIEGERYVTDYLPGASAVYVSGMEKTFDDAYFYGIGYSTEQEITDEVSSQYGHGAVVLAAGQGTDVTLNNPTIIGDPQGRSNGVFASAMSKITVNGGTINTDCTFGAHGLDVTYMGHIYAYDTVIHTTGGASGAIASDFGGGFVYGEGLDCTTDGGGSPAIFAAGSSIFMMKDCNFQVNKCNGIVLSVYNTAVMLDNCTLTCTGGACLSGNMSMGSEVGDRADIFHSTLESTDSAVISTGGSRTLVNMVDTTAIAGSSTAIACMGGALTVNLWDTELTGNISCSSGDLTINLYAGGKLTGEVSGNGNVVINVYEGGEYVGSFAATEQSGGEPSPEPATFDEYLASWWAYGTLLWNEETAENYVKNVEPEIIANSAAAYVVEGAAAVTYDPATYDPSENGMDLSLIHSAGAAGPTAGRAATEAASAEAAAEASAEPSGEASGEASAEASGEAS